jgi:glycosyltransferase involved in cell wall biosynthesis
MARGLPRDRPSDVVKIALVVPGGVDRSGTERVIPCLLWLVERLTAANHEVHLFALNQEPASGEWLLLGARVHNAGGRRRRLRTVTAMLREHRKQPFDVIHAFWAGAPGQAAALFSAITRVPFAVTLPGGDLAALPDIDYGARLRWRGRLSTWAVLSRASAIVVPSDWMAAEATALGWPTITIPFGVAVDRWPAARPRPRPPGTPIRLIHAASLNRVKDPFGLLRAMRLLADQGVEFTLDIIGEDTLSGAVQRCCADLGLDARVRFHGFVPNAELRDWFERSDLLVMNSRHETGPIVLLEAAMAGVPTVGTAVGTIADWSSDAAVAVPTSDPGALASAIARLAEDDEERLRLATAAQARARRHDADAYARALVGLYAELATSSRKIIIRWVRLPAASAAASRSSFSDSSSIGMKASSALRMRGWPVAAGLLPISSSS